MPALVKLAAAALLVAAASIYGLTTVSASIPRWTVIYIWASVALAVFPFCIIRDKLKFDHIDGLALLALVWAGLSLGWSSDWRQGQLQLTNCGALFVLFVWIRRVNDWLPEAALLTVVVALVLQYLYPWDWGGHGNRNFQTEAIILALCVALNAHRLETWIAWVLITPIAVGYLLIGNPSKIEFIVIPALIAWWFLGSPYRNARKLRAVAH